MMAALNVAPLQVPREICCCYNLFVEIVSYNVIYLNLSEKRRQGFTEEEIEFESLERCNELVRLKVLESFWCFSLTSFSDSVLGRLKSSYLFYVITVGSK